MWTQRGSGCLGRSEIGQNVIIQPQKNTLAQPVVLQIQYCGAGVVATVRPVDTLSQPITSPGILAILL